jgi:hypothetical protein
VKNTTLNLPLEGRSELPFRQFREGVDILDDESTQQETYSPATIHAGSSGPSYTMPVAAFPSPLVGEGHEPCERSELGEWGEGYVCSRSTATTYNPATILPGSSGPS